MTSSHNERKHSKFAASAADRWFNCSASVAISEGLPDVTSEAALEGTKAHECLEQMVKWRMLRRGLPDSLEWNEEMRGHALAASDHILKVHLSYQESELLVEQRVLLDFIHPEAFGSLDYAILEHFGTLHIMDYKYGKKYVSPIGNRQFLFYALGVAHKYHWNFQKVRMWTLQPRARGFDGYAFWEITIDELIKSAEHFKAAIDRVENHPTYKEGDWCYFCKAKKICPLKADKRLEQARKVFS